MDTHAKTMLLSPLMTLYSLGFATKAREIQRATEAYLLLDGSEWSSTPIKGFRYSLMELMHPLVSTHSQLVVSCRTSDASQDIGHDMLTSVYPAWMSDASEDITHDMLTSVYPAR